MTFPRRESLQRWSRFLALPWAIGIVSGAMLRGTPWGTHLRTEGFSHMMVHFLAFAVLGWLSSFAVSSTRSRIIVLACAIFYGLGTEYLEHLIGNNPIETDDVLFDTVGVLIGAGITPRSKR